MRRLNKGASCASVSCSVVMSLRPSSSSSGCAPYRRADKGQQGHSVTELRCCETASTGMVDVLGQLRAEAAGELMVGLHRYAFHVPSLAASLANINVFR